MSRAEKFGLNRRIDMRRVRTPLAAVLASLALLARPPFAGAQVAGPPDLEGDAAEVMAIVDSALALISAEDFAGFTNLMLEEAPAFIVYERRDGGLGYSFRSRAEQRAMEAGGDYVERGFDPEVRIQGHLATVWLPYDFYTDDQLSHCGVDAFILLRTDEGWRIASIAWTFEQPPDCRLHPDGPPSGG